ncbi:ferrochelatase [Campylobacter geochelonis]|uniref:ferrochelatase n=1 Tax=Campylobacter geochelonis TaxID=1780362 RepID=UPI000770ACD5|nr:ferrochelatase [Campylobacter geochelonis]CZE51205.1 ferrochelatase [Campylobacter geochelonis]
MKKALILLNMGGPNNLDEVSVFLKNMFNDRYILTIKNSFFRSILANLITKFRVKAATQNYKAIGGKSPIVDITDSLVKKLRKEVEFDVDYAMNYTPPFSKDVFKKYESYDEIVLFPLYPHHSTTTVISSLDDAKKAIKELGISAKIYEIPTFFENKIYNNIIINSIKNSVSGLNNDEISNTTLIFSAHSLPQKIINRGDMYENDIENHVDILSDLLEKENLNFKEIKLAYQSRLGPVQWLGPNLSEVLPTLENKRALIYPISFCVDNSETDFELSIEYNHIAKKNNFEFYGVVKCPNDSDEFVEFIKEISKI